MTTSGTVITGAYSGRGAGAAVVAAVLGLVPAVFLGSLRFILGEDPDAGKQFAGNVAFGLTYFAPYLLVLMASKVERPGARGALLAALGVLSLAASFSAIFSLITLALLPATLAIWFASARSLTASVHPLATTTFAAIAGILIAAIVGLSFFALFWLGEPEPRCWVLTLGADGEYVWEERPNVGGPGGLSAGILSGTDRESSCVSDTISNLEAGVSVGLLLVAFFGMILTMRLPWMRPPDSSNA